MRVWLYTFGIHNLYRLPVSKGIRPNLRFDKFLARTRAVASAENFISLRQHLCEQGLREFTDAAQSLPIARE